MDNYISRKDVAKLFNVTERTIDRWRQQGLNSYIIGGKLVRFKKEDVENWVKERRC